jgi:hypothetical protein
MLAHEVEGLKKLNIPVKKWGSSYRVQIRKSKSRSKSLVYVSSLTPSVKADIIKTYKITLKQLDKALSPKSKSEMYKILSDGSKDTHTYLNISESDFHDRLENLMNTQQNAYKINIALGYDIYDFVNDVEFNYHANIINTSIFKMPFAVNNRSDINNIFQAIKNKEKEATIYFNNSACKLKSITEYQVVIYKLNYMLGDSEAIMPDIIKNNKHVINFKSTQNKCMFHCIAYNSDTNQNPNRLQSIVKNTFKQYCDYKNIAYSTQLYKTFKPIDILEFDILEDCFKVNIEVYTMDVDSGDMADRRSPQNPMGSIQRKRQSDKSYDKKLNILAHEGHAMYITSMDMFLSKYVCDKCGTVFTSSESKRDHIKNKCELTEIESFVKNPTIYRPSENTIKGLLSKYSIKGIDHYIDHFIVYDFEAILKPISIQHGDKTEFTSQHIPVSVSICNSLDKEVKCFVNDSPKQLLTDMFEYINKISNIIYEYNVSKFDTLTEIMNEKGMNKDVEKLDKILHKVPVIGFNSGRYDINLIKNDLFAVIGKIDHVIKNPSYMCIATDEFKMLDISNYLPPATSYDKYLKTFLGECKCPKKIQCTCNLGKGVFCYEYITDFNKLSETTIPPREAFDSSLRNTKISDDDYERIKFVWDHYKMKSIMDLLIWYNNLDVIPFIDAVKEQREFYKNYDLDMLVDGVSLPSLAEKVMYQTCFNNLITQSTQSAESFNFPQSRYFGYKEQDDKAKREFNLSINHLDILLKKQKYLCTYCKCKLDKKNASADRINNKKGHIDGNIVMSCITCNCARKDMSMSTFRYQKLLEYNSNRLVYSIDEPNKDIYSKMKANIAGGPSIIFNRYSKRNETYIRGGSKLCKKVIGYDANALYLWALGNEMPCGQLTTIETYDSILDDIRADNLFGFLECDIETPEHLKGYFEEMCPIFKNIEIDPSDKNIIGEHMYEYNKSKGANAAKKSKKLIGSYFGHKILIYTPLLKWYLDHGMIITKTYSFIKASGYKAFKPFMETVSNARREGDSDPNKKTIAEMMKLIGNSAFGRSGMDKTKHKEVKYTTDSKSEDRLTNHYTFFHKEQLDGSCEITLKKRRIKQNNPIHLSIAIYQLAKLRMLQFYYDCIDKYFDRSDFQYEEMDTDSAYISFSNEKPFENIIKPEQRDDFEKNKYNWFPRDFNQEVANFDKRTPGLFKDEWSGDAMVSLSSKNYICYLPDSIYKEKVSAKGVQQKGRNQDVLNQIGFENVVKNKITLTGTNKGFRLCKESKSIITYSQTKTALSYMYDKRQVLSCGIRTIPLNI